MTRYDTPEAKELFVSINNAILRYQEKTGHEVMLLRTENKVLDQIAVRVIQTGEILPVYYDKQDLEPAVTHTAIKNDPLALLEEIADLPCSCTPEQESGADPTVCRSCRAGNHINSIYEDMRNALTEITGK